MTPELVSAERRLLRLLLIQRIARSPEATSDIGNLHRLSSAVRDAWDGWDTALKAAYEFRDAYERQHTFTGTGAAE